MLTNLLIWGVVLLGTYLNIMLVSLRWLEPTLSIPWPSFTGNPFRAFVTGIMIYVAALAVWEQLRERRWLWVPLSVALSLGTLYLFGPKMSLQEPTNPLHDSLWLIGGFVGSVIAFRPHYAPRTKEPRFSLHSFPWFFFVSVNVLMFLIPMSPLSPGFEQTDLRGVGPQDIIFGSIHSDKVPSYIYLRNAVNALFAAPSINATPIVSSIVASVALAITASAVSVISGSLWGWVFLMVALTDHWVVAAAISSSVVAGPFISTAIPLILGVWALYRPKGPLSFKEASFVGLAGAFGTMYNLFGYAAGRIPWVAGSGCVGLILLARGTFSFRPRSLASLIPLLAPTVICVAAVIHYIYDGNPEALKSRVFISPAKELVVAADAVPPNARRFRNPDTIIWWGTARDDVRNATIFWIRTPSELYEEIKWMIGAIERDAPVEKGLLFIALLAVAVGATSSNPRQRKGLLCFGLFTFVASLGYLLGEDQTAYRRGTYASIGLSALLVSLFAYFSRPKFRLAAAGLCGVACLIRLPQEVPPILSDKMYAPICSMCQHQIPVKMLALDPLLTSYTDRQMYFPSLRSDESQPARCQSLVIDTVEFKRVAPRSVQITIPSNSLADVFSTLNTGDVSVTRCSPELAKTNPLCTSEIPGTKLLGTIPRNADPNRPVWWALHEKI